MGAPSTVAHLPGNNEVMGARITRLDRATVELWEEAERVSLLVDLAVPDRMIALLHMLDGLDDGFAVDQLGHALQTATRAERAGADGDVIVAALFHDVGKLFGDEFHDSVSGEILRGHVRDDVCAVVRHHQDFTARYLAPTFGGDGERRSRWAAKEWFTLAERFVDEWDQLSFDPGYDTETLDHFTPVLRRVLTTTTG
jgi:predicted HD phosphohydrolase